MNLKEEVEKLSLDLNILTNKLNEKTLARDTVELLDRLINNQRNSIITAQSTALITACTQLRALLTSDPPY
jgi:hypothetical protein